MILFLFLNQNEFYFVVFFFIFTFVDMIYKEWFTYRLLKILL